MLKRCVVLLACCGTIAGCDSISPELLRSLLGAAAQTDDGVVVPGSGGEPPIGAPGDPGAPHEPSPAVRIFARFDGIKGEVNELAHDGWIECSAYRTMIQIPEVEGGGGGGLGVIQPEFSQFELDIPFERAVPEILDRLLRGTVLNRAMVDVVDPANALLLTRYELEDAFFTAADLSAAPEKAGISFTFSRLMVTRFFYDESGKPTGETSACYDLATAEGC